MKRLLMVLLVVALLVSAWVISGWRDKNMTLARTKSQPDFKLQDYTKSPPTYVVYNLLFKQVLDINQKATAEKASGQSVTTFQSMRQTLKRNLNLTDDQDLILDNIATECTHETGLIDQQAKEIIESFWAKYPPGTVFPEENRPKLPKELGELQDKHDEVILKCRDRLRQQLGDAGFASFESGLYRGFGSKITTVPRTPKKIE